jgi:undecaprenyl-diphosphatase
VVWLRQQEPVVLFAFLLVVTGTWAFVELADEVLEGTTQSFDVWVVQLLRNPQDLALPLGPRWLAAGGRDVTALGSNAVLTLIVAIVVGFLHLQRQHKTMWLVFLAVCSGSVLSQLLKLGFARPRPDFVPHAATMTQSFPSGHSLLSAVVYLSLGALLAQQEQRRRIKIYFLGVALCLTFLIGISRIYLGVHYPTDVLAGWTVGLVWAMMWWLIARYMRC